MSVEVTYKGNQIASFTGTTKTLKTSGKYMEDDVTISESGGSATLQAKTDINPTESSQTIYPDSNYDGFSSVQINAISSSYVGSGITRRDSTDLTASGATVTAPSGYYASSASKTIASGSVTAPSSISGTSATVSTGTNTLTLSKTISVTPSVTSAGYISAGTAGNSTVSLTASVNTRTSSDLTVSGDTITAPAGYYGSQATKSVASGTAGTPTASKGSVSNHSVTVTPSVTNVTGYITGGTKTGTGVSVSASELVSGTYNVSSSGTADVTNYASISVPSGTAGTPSATKGSVSNHTITVTPSVTNTTGYISGGTLTGTGVSVSASELVSGNKAITENGSNIDVTNYATVSVDVSGGTAAISVVDTTDTAGGTIRTITALDISDTTAIASDVASGKYFYTAAGVKTQGTASGGGGGGADVETGTFTGSGGITVQISCEFEPDMIYIHGDLSNDTSLRGVVSLMIVKDTVLYATSDGSQSAVQEFLYKSHHGIINYNENNQSGEPYASYSNGTLTVNTVENTSTCRFASGVTYSYKLVGYSSVS